MNYLLSIVFTVRCVLLQDHENAKTKVIQEKERLHQDLDLEQNEQKFEAEKSDDDIFALKQVDTEIQTFDQYFLKVP